MGTSPDPEGTGAPPDRGGAAPAPAQTPRPRSTTPEFQLPAAFISHQNKHGQPWLGLGEVPVPRGGDSPLVPTATAGAQGSDCTPGCCTTTAMSWTGLSRAGRGVKPCPVLERGSSVPPPPGGGDTAKGGAQGWGRAGLTPLDPPRTPPALGVRAKAELGTSWVGGSHQAEGGSGDRQGQPRAGHSAGDGHPVPTSSTPLLPNPRGSRLALPLSPRSSHPSWKRAPCLGAAGTRGRCCFGGGTSVAPSRAGGDRGRSQGGQPK